MTKEFMQTSHSHSKTCSKMRRQGARFSERSKSFWSKFM